MNALRLDASTNSLRVQVPHNLVLRAWVVVIVVQVLGKYMIIRYLDPLRITITQIPVPNCWVHEPSRQPKDLRPKLQP